MPDTTYMKSQVIGGVTVASVRCEKIGSREAPIIEMDLRAAAEGTGHRLVVDLTQVTLLASMGLGMLVSLHKHCADRKGKLAMYGLSEDISQLLKLTHLDKLLRIAPDQASAIKQAAA